MTSAKPSPPDPGGGSHSLGAARASACGSTPPATRPADDRGGLGAQHPLTEAHRREAARDLARAPATFRTDEQRVTAREACAPARLGEARPWPEEAEHLAEGQRVNNLWQVDPAALRPRLARHLAEALPPSRPLGAVEADHRAVRKEGDDPVHAELSELLHRPVGALPLRQRERDRQRWRGASELLDLAVGFEDESCALRPPASGDVAAAEAPPPVGDDHRLPPAHAQDVDEMVRIGEGGLV